MPGNKKNYFLKQGYQSKSSNTTIASTDNDIYWDEQRIANARFYQYAVYQYAQEQIQKFGLHSVLDVGCGIATKLHELIVPVCKDIVGIDQKETIAINTKHFPEITFYADDLERPTLALRRTFDLIICADVIEHMLTPDTLLNNIKRYAHSNTYFLFSTPERDILRGPENMSSPNETHVREWNKEEFTAYLTSKGLPPAESKIVYHCTLGLNKLTAGVIANRLLRGVPLKHTQLHLCRYST